MIDLKISETKVGYIKINIFLCISLSNNAVMCSLILTLTLKHVSFLDKFWQKLE